MTGPGTSAYAGDRGATPPGSEWTATSSGRPPAKVVSAMLCMSALFGLAVGVLQLGYGLSRATVTPEAVFRAALVGAGATLALHRWFCWVLRLRRPEPAGAVPIDPPQTSS